MHATSHGTAAAVAEAKLYGTGTEGSPPSTSARSRGSRVDPAVYIFEESLLTTEPATHAHAHAMAQCMSLRRISAGAEAAAGPQ